MKSLRRYAFFFLILNYESSHAFQALAPLRGQTASHWIVETEQRRLSLSSRSRTTCDGRSRRRTAVFQTVVKDQDESDANRDGASAKDVEPLPTAANGLDVDLSPADALSEERKASLFQFLLRDLQVEGVPLLEVEMNRPAMNRQDGDGYDDASAANFAILQAALWTTMAELVDQSTFQQQQNQHQKVSEDSPGDGDSDADTVNSSKACLVVENVRVQDLLRFVEFFETNLKSENSAVARHFPEIRRMRLSIVGKGIGPALLMEVANPLAANSSIAAPPATHATTPVPVSSSEKEYRAVAAMKMFVDRAMPWESVAGESAERSGDASVQYRSCSFADIFHIQSAFWNCMCELVLLHPDGKRRTDDGGSGFSIFFLIPEADRRGQGAFEALTLALTQGVQLYMEFASRGQDGASFVELPVEVHYFSPTYDREMIHPTHALIPGHLPPLSWFRSHRGANDRVDDNDANGNSSESDVTLLNLQRQSPVTACLLRLPSTSHRVESESDMTIDGSTDARTDTDHDSSRGQLPEIGSVLAETRSRLIHGTLISQQRLVRRTLEQAHSAELEVLETD